MLVAATALACVGCEREPPADVAALESAVRRFYLGMASEVGGENRAAMESLIPVREDFAALFPGRDEALWEVWQPERQALLDNAALHSEQYRAVLPLGAMHTADLRREGSDALKRVLRELPPAVPALGVRLEVAQPAGERIAAAFVFVGGRWVWIWDLERAAEIIGAR